MDQFDRAFEEVTQSTNPAGPTSALVLGVERTTIDAIRASLEVVGFNVSQVSTVAQFEKAISQEEYGLIVTTANTTAGDWHQVFELVSLLTPNTPIVGYSDEPECSGIIDFIRAGGSDFFCLPEDLNLIAPRATLVMQKAQETACSNNKAKHAINVCNEINEERHRVSEENDSLCHELANAHCEEKKKLQQVAIGAEFRALIGQELEVEAMLRTALGYMLMRVGALNAAVFLREGDLDWGVGAFVNYDRQDDQFKELVDELAPAVCSLVSTDEQLKRYTDGELFANLIDLDPVEFSGTEVVSFGCFYENRCMAVMVLFRGDSQPFTNESTETLDTLRSIFGQQLGKILALHRRAKTQWPSESIDDDDWSLGKAA